MESSVAEKAPRCSVCQRPLTDPESIKIGMGPVCAARNPHLVKNDQPDEDEE